ncbi:50S ribosomal protein L25 [Candidatus Dojkabacteria bacterium]|nr:50S ribosomal protein L25 [Candidatus Dojkabacteria bacterium]
MLTIKAKKRNILGRKVKNLRKEGSIPATVYGPKKESEPVTVDYKEFEKVFNEAGHSQMVNFEYEGEKEEGKVLIKEVQLDSLTNRFQHVSLYQVDMDRKINIEVPIRYDGVPQAVKINIGFLVTPVTEVAVRSLPMTLPSEFVVKVEHLAEVGDSVLVRDISLPEGVEFDFGVPLNNAIAYIAPPQKEIVEEEKPAEGVEGEDDAASEGEEGAEGKEGESKEGETGEEKKDEKGQEKKD